MKKHKDLFKIYIRNFYFDNRIGKNYFFMALEIWNERKAEKMTLRSKLDEFLKFKKWFKSRKTNELVDEFINTLITQEADVIKRNTMKYNEQISKDRENYEKKTTTPEEARRVYGMVSYSKSEYHI